MIDTNLIEETFKDMLPLSDVARKLLKEKTPYCMRCPLAKFTDDLGFTCGFQSECKEVRAKVLEMDDKYNG